MYTLLSGLYRHWTRKEEYYVIIIGLDNAGKTTLLERIKSIFTGVQGLPPEKIAPTIGLNIGKISLDKVHVNFWDLGGQLELHSIWEKYYAEAHAVIFVVDSTDVARLETVKSTFDRVVTSDALEGLPILMLANKQDVPGCLRVEEIKEVFNPIAVQLGARDSKVLPCVALTGSGVRDAVDWLFVRIQRNRIHRPPVFRE
ncbi:small GTP-binding protein domain [Allomyces macrogynus ATCC 38327]|nr:ADP-ribosylation factor protein 3 [Allomyces javanicus]KAJ3367483.1 ADP-ribosylation factor protein 3 [Allomyces arbusculus]KNE64784.1 small GTP-binding protein domain [Allomyces macrogynus ATCC 38327]|eukprot:KNE64784.1 small GTP-binding protein domain [Allomyces macrogynus ATCC 38327]